MRNIPTPVAGGKTSPIRSTEEKLVSLLEIAFFAGLIVVLCSPFLSKTSWLIFVQDDFLYYLKVAINISHGHGSAFNGLTKTNGYQPLWLLAFVGLSWFTENTDIIFGFLALTIFLSALATYIFARRILRQSGARPLLLLSLAGWVTLYSVTLFFYGMEVILTIPIMLCVIWLIFDMTWVSRNWFTAFLFGLLLSGMVLSRIDTLIFGALVLSGMLLYPETRKLFRADLIVGLVAGLSPLCLYFMLNHINFNTWLPVSGMAKELKHGHAPSLEPWRVFIHPLAAAFTSLILAAVLVLVVQNKRFSARSRVVIVSTLAFPFVYYFVLSCVSDWTLWGWYMYPIRTAICVSFLVFLYWPALLRFLEKNIVTGLLVASVFVCLFLLRWTRQQTDIYDASLEIQQFASNHPGIYAMGDRAGRVGYMISNPVVQTEGLMMDREFLRYIAAETPIRETLAHYHVRYYIATAYEPFTGCFHAVEPAKAGPASHKMRDIFCEQPEATFSHDGIQTLIYDLEKK